VSDGAEGGEVVRQVTWYFDFVSPFAYLQWRMLDRVSGLAEISAVPVLFAGLLSHWKTVGPAELPAKRTFTYRFCHWLAGRHGIPFRMPPKHPFPPLRPLRLALLLGCKPAAIDAIFAAIWAEGHDLEAGAEWNALLARLGGPVDEAGLASAAIKDALRANTEAAIANGVWGVPTIMIDRELFWGADATEMALAYLADPEMFGRGDYARLGALPVGVQRPR
jgi:2-hydroxychromene-2-carboxylate isomerase